MSADLGSSLALCEPHGPWAYLATSKSASGWALNPLLPQPGTVVRRVRGQRCQTTQTLLAEWAHAFGFPSYFGHNWDAFYECITDLEWLPAHCYIALVTDASAVLPHDEAGFVTFIEVLNSAATEWATPQEGEWARPAVAFRVLFRTDVAQEDHVCARLQYAGVDPSPMSFKGM